MRIEANVTDQGGSLTSTGFPINATGKITITRRAYLHYGNSYFIGRFSIYMGEMPEFSVQYANMSYDSYPYMARYGFFLGRNGAWSHMYTSQSDIGPAISAVWDTWFNEKIIYTPTNGVMEYYIDDVLKQTFNVGIMPASQAPMLKLHFNTWGWYTGHQHYFDDLVVTQEFDRPTRAIGLSGELAFGTVTIGTSAQRTLTITNAGNQGLSISGISFPAGFSGSFGGLIAPGGSTNVPVTFSPSAAVAYNGVITVNSDASTGTNTISTSGTGALCTYTITTSVSPPGAGLVAGGGTVGCGSGVNLVASPNTGYSFVNWTESGTAVSTTSNYTFTAAGSRTLVANFEQQMAALTVQANPVSGGTVTGSGSYQVGSSVPIAATANTGWDFSGWNDGSMQTNRSVVVPLGGATYTAYFQQQAPTAMITVQASPPIGGTVTGGGTFVVGSQQTLSATASSGWVFSGWSDGNGANPRTVVVPAGGATLKANFALAQLCSGIWYSTLAGLAGSNGSTDATGNAARFNAPRGLAVDTNDNVYVADSQNHTIRKISPAGVVTTFAGLAGSSGSADGVGSAARFNFPARIVVDADGNLYVADAHNYTIRKIASDRTVTTLAGSAGNSGSADGTGNAARFCNPDGIGLDSHGNLFVADLSNYTIRKITPAGAVTTFAGAAGVSDSVDGTGSAARFKGPYGMTIDSADNLYVADGFSTIRKITPAGVVTTLAGLAGSRGSTDGTGSAARFSMPFGVAVDSAGNIFVADAGNCAIRKVTPTGVVTTVGGPVGVYISGSTDGCGNDARFYAPVDVTLSSTGDLYISDNMNNTIRKGCSQFRLWLSAYGLGTTGADDQVDSDGDGKSNREEYLAGTDPTQSNSALRSALTRNEASQGFTIEWSSVPGRSYKVLYADNPGGPWLEDLPSSQVTAGAGETTKSYTDGTVGTASRRFYRVKLIIP